MIFVRDKTVIVLQLGKSNKGARSGSGRTLNIKNECGLFRFLKELKKPLKDSLSNIAAGIMLLILRPYKQGDYIDCGSVSGTIQEMGLFSTVLKTPDGLFVSAPNSVVFGTPIKNYSRNPTRRSDITVGVAYADSLPVAVNAMKEIMEQEPMILKDPAPEVLVAELADSSVQLTLRYWTATENYWPAYWSIKSQLKPAIEAAGLRVPFPQRIITFVNAPAEKPGA